VTVAVPVGIVLAPIGRLVTDPLLRHRLTKIQFDFS